MVQRAAASKILPAVWSGPSVWTWIPHDHSVSLLSQSGDGQSAPQLKKQLYILMCLCVTTQTQDWYQSSYLTLGATNWLVCFPMMWNNLFKEPQPSLSQKKKKKKKHAVDWCCFLPTREHNPHNDLSLSIQKKKKKKKKKKKTCSRFTQIKQPFYAEINPDLCPALFFSHSHSVWC